MRRTLIFTFSIFCFSLFAQDNYHTELVESLAENYAIENPEFVVSNTEQANFNAQYIYGDYSQNLESVSNQGFTLVQHIKVNSAGVNVWDSNMGFSSTKTVEKDDAVLVSFWGRSISTTTELWAFAEDGVDYEKEYYGQFSLTPDWTQYFMSLKADKTYNIGRFVVGFHLAAQPQEFEIAGFTVLNYKDKHDESELPSIFSPGNYEGNEADAPWRALAEARIESIRKSDLSIQILDQNGAPVSNANVNVEMQKHAFGFGSAIVTCRMPGNNCYNPLYVDKLHNLDGKGHGFNIAVTENALKWRAWENNWLGTPEETISALTYLHENGIPTRGHNLFWPGSDFLPQDINNNLSDIDYLRTRIDNRIEEMIGNDEIAAVVRDWDVLNEIAVNRDLEFAFDSDPAFANGRELYKDIFTKVKALDPDLQLYINDYVVLSGGGSAPTIINRYKQFLDELIANETPFDGIGFQGHIGTQPTSIPKTLQVYDEFAQRYNKRMMVTEYDINPSVDEETQGKYLEDFMTATFSHPFMDAFIMWGFWDGNHWKDNSAMFDIDWNLKESGASFIKKVFNDWWTSENLTSDDNGFVSVRPFKGVHVITVEKNGIVSEHEITLESNMDTTIVVDFSSSLEILDKNLFTLTPNPSESGFVTFEMPETIEKAKVEVINSEGVVLKVLEINTSKSTLDLAITTGVYIVNIKTAKGNVTKKLIIQ